MGTFVGPSHAVFMLKGGTEDRPWETAFAIFDLERSQMTHLLQSPLHAQGTHFLSGMRLGEQVGFPSSACDLVDDGAVFRDDGWSLMFFRLPVLTAADRTSCVGYSIPFDAFAPYLDPQPRVGQSPVWVPWSEWSARGVRVGGQDIPGGPYVDRWRGSRNDFMDFHPSRVAVVRAQAAVGGRPRSWGSYAVGTDPPRLGRHVSSTAVLSETEARGALGPRVDHITERVGYVDMSLPSSLTSDTRYQLLLSNDSVFEVRVRVRVSA